MGRDGMLPSLFARVDHRTQTPVQNTVIVAVIVAIMAALVPLDYLIGVVSIGTLTAFIVVSLGVIILRVREPDLPRGFKVPGYPVTPVLSILACGYILFSLHWYTWVIFSGWVIAFLIFYLAYGRRHSVSGHGHPPAGRGGLSGECRRRLHFPHKSGRGSLDLGLQQAYVLGQPMVIVTVVPRQWSTPSLAKVDAEFAEYSRAGGQGGRDPGPGVSRGHLGRRPGQLSGRSGRSTSSALLDILYGGRGESAGARFVHRRRGGPDHRRHHERQTAALRAPAGRPRAARLPF